MKISEKQIQQLILYLTQISAESGATFTEEGRLGSCRLIADIANQQSEKIEEIDGE